MMVACALMVAVRPFAGPRRSPKDRPADPGWGLWLGPAILGILGLILGLVPVLIEETFIARMVSDVAEVHLEGHLALWHGLGPALLLSLVTFALGGLLYASLDRVRDGLAAAEPRLPRTEAWYDRALAATLEAASSGTRALQNGRMTHYLRGTFFALGFVTLVALIAGETYWPAFALSPALIDWAIVALIVASIFVVLVTHSRLTAITALGGVGAGIAMIFVLYGAIDVAMTQLFVEILVVVFLAIAMVRLPPAGAIGFRIRDAAIAAFLGITVTLALLSVLAADPDPYLTTFFEEKSVPDALGHNIVNVILVDFRGFDTMGEISVIVIAGLAATAALLAGRRTRR
jgi:multicomponent Na+:H+ antiporter subunit A